MEKECLALLLRGEQPVVICLGRALESLRLPSVWKRPLDAGRLLLISPFEAKCSRVTEKTAGKRNQCVMALADDILVTHANSGGRLERLCRAAASAGKTLWTIDDPANAGLIELGSRTVLPEQVPAAWRAGKLPATDARS